MYGKKVVVIGIGNSGGDIAVEASRVADEVLKTFLFSSCGWTLWFLILTQATLCRLSSSSRSAGVPEHSPWRLGHPSGFRQRPAGGHEVQHALRPHPVPAFSDELLQLVR